MSGKWDINQDGLELWEVDKTALTASYTHNQKIMVLGNTRQLILYLDYTKGGELSVDIHIEVARPGTENEFIILTSFSESLTAKYREVAIDVSRAEKYFRVSMKATGTPDALTNVKLYFSPNTNKGIFDD